MSWIILIGIFGLLIAYLLLWPISPKPKGGLLTPAAPELSGVYEENNRLRSASRFGEGFCESPESTAIDSEGRVYAGMEDGRIMMFSSDGKNADLFVNTGGRPLGMAFDTHGNLIVADREKGLLCVDPDRTITVLTNEVDGCAIVYANDLDIAEDGTIYFSDFQHFKSKDNLADFLDGRPLTRLLAYDPASRATRVVLDGLYAANGVALGPNDQYILVNEFLAYRVTRFWLKGPKIGQRESFIENLPGMPDNITFNGHDTFWLAIYNRRSAIFELLQSKPFLRGIMRRLPEFMISTDPVRYGFVLGLDLDGNVIHNLQDPSGEVVSQVTSVLEHDQMLFLGNIGDDAINCLPAPKETKGKLAI